jgi:DNA-binding SARP family transcriptional activator
MQFRVLGPLEVAVDDGPIEVGRGKRRTLLGLLLLEANRVVSHDRLIEVLWGETAPATRRGAVHVLISELRRVLGDERIVTRPAGYVLRVGPEELDTERFGRLLAAGREQLVAGRPGQAEAALREALALWRGPPLQDFAYDDFAQAEIARLEELRLDAEEELLEAELALGRGDELVPRLEALIERSPRREHLYGQLMLALYHAQRQSEALEIYQKARGALIEELGVEPSPALQRLQQAILQQDPALEPAAPLHPLAPLARRRRRLLLPFAVSALLAGLGLGLFLTLRGGKSADVAVTPVPARSVAVIDPATNRVVAVIPLAAGQLATQDDPEGIAVGYGSVWVTDGGQQTVLRIDPGTRKIVQTIGLGTDVRTLAVGFGSIWVAGGDSAAVTRIDASTNRVAATIPIGSSHGVANTAFAIAAGAGGIWTAAGANAIVRIDPATNRVAERVRVPAVYSLTADRRYVWIGTWVSDSAIFRIARHGSRATFATLEPGEGVGLLAVQGNVLWAVVATGTTLLERYDLGTGKLEDAFDVARAADALASTPEALWLGEGQSRDVVRVDPRSGRVAARIGVRRPVVALAVGEGAVWAAVGK